MSNFNIVDIKESKKWNEIVTSFPQYDVYYLSNYAKAFQIHGDGHPMLLNFETDDLRGVNVFMMRDIARFAPFKEKLPPGTCFDIATPYGFGGFLFDGDTSESSIRQYYTRYLEFLKNQNIVSKFTRYHPQIKNANTLRPVTTVVDLGETVSMDLESEDTIWANTSSNCRNHIRRAEKSGIGIFHGRSLELLYDFRKIYNVTMDHDKADPYYYFEKKFYESIHTDMHDNYELFYAVWGEAIIAMAIMIYANKRMHCHLCGSLFEYRYLAPLNLIFFEAARWGNKQGLKTLHLGGGIGSEEDNLLRFKKTFNRNSDNRFSIGKEILNKEMYDQLVETRKQSDPTFNCESSYFPLYRA